MRITERRLRKIIRRVIRESISEVENPVNSFIDSLPEDLLTSFENNVETIFNESKSIDLLESFGFSNNKVKRMIEYLTVAILLFSQAANIVPTANRMDVEEQCAAKVESVYNDSNGNLGVEDVRKLQQIRRELIQDLNNMDDETGVIGQAIELLGKPTEELMRLIASSSQTNQILKDLHSSRFINSKEPAHRFHGKDQKDPDVVITNMGNTLGFPSGNTYDSRSTVDGADMIYK